MSHAQKHLFFFIDCKNSPIPKQTSALGISNLSQFTLLCHFCICLLKSPDTALYILWSSSLLMNLKVSPIRTGSNLHCSVWIILHFISVLKFQQSDEGRLFPCIFGSTVCLLVPKEIKRASVYCPYRSSRMNIAQSEKSLGGQSGNGILPHLRHLCSYLRSCIPSVIHFPLPAKSLFSAWWRAKSSASSFSPPFK